MLFTERRLFLRSRYINCLLSDHRAISIRRRRGNRVLTTRRNRGIRVLRAYRTVGSYSGGPSALPDIALASRELEEAESCSQADKVNHHRVTAVALDPEVLRTPERWKPHLTSDTKTGSSRIHDIRAPLPNYLARADFSSSARRKMR